MARSWGTVVLSNNARFSGEVGPTNLYYEMSYKGMVPNKCCNTFKEIMIKPRIRRIFANLRQNTQEMLNGDLQKRSQSIPTHRHNSHHTYHQQTLEHKGYIS
jgi:hypothetical protein